MVKNKNKSSITKPLLLAGLSVVQADQPVHCLGNDILGVWNFHVSTDQQSVDLFHENEVCTHQLPNKLQVINQNYKFNFPTDNVMKINLNEDVTAEAKSCQNGVCNGAPIKGSWFAFYD